MIQGITIKAFLDNLTTLIPEKLGELSDQDRLILQEKISNLFKQIQSNDIPPEHNELIDELAERAETLNLLSPEGLMTVQKISSRIARMTLSNVEISNNDTLVDDPSKLALLKDHSQYFKGLLEDTDSMKEVYLPLPGETVELLISCLMKPELPDDKKRVLELIHFAGAYSFDELLKSLEEPFLQFLQQHQDDLLNNAEDWLSVISTVNQTHPLIASKWFAFIIPLFLNKLNIQVETSGYLFPFKYLNAFFDEKSRDIMKYFPLMLDIQTIKTLNDFQRVCNENPMKSPLSIKLFCRFPLSRDEETSIIAKAKASNIQLTIKRNVLPSGTKFFGKELWEYYLGKVEDLPPPSHMDQWLESDCCLPGPDNVLVPTGLKWKEMGVVFLLPKTIDGQPLTANLFRTLIQKPKNKGTPVQLDVSKKLFATHGDQPVENSVWAFLSYDVIKGSRNRSATNLHALVAAIPHCEVPGFLAAQVGIVTHFLDTGEKLYNKKPWTCTLCKETVQSVNRITITFLGGFDAVLSMFRVPRNEKDEDVGIAAFRTFAS